MTFKQIRQRAEFLKNLLELPPLKKRIGEMRYGTVSECYHGNVMVIVVGNNDVFHLLYH